MSVLLIGGLASIFYHIGEHEYTRKGWLLALISLILSLGVGSTELGFLGILGSNLVLYLICLGYNLISDKPPTSGL
jgi:uncharacterized membrane protein HdeD (DUF308 family)